MNKEIIYFGKKVVVSCDENCNKAWGISQRPHILFSETNEDDIAYLSDDELGDAPIDPKTYEGGDAKPINKENIPNRWCVRQCERCYFIENEDSKPTDFSKRVYNIPSLHKNE